MNDMAPDNERIFPGANNPPANLIDELAERYKPTLDQFAELKAAAESAPETIADDETQTKVAELIKKMRFVEKTLDGARELERDPFAKKVTEVNGFFKTRIEPLEKLRKILNERSQAYLDKRAEAERRRLQEEEDKRRREAAENMAKAQEAERTKNAATVAANELEGLATAARTARATAVSEVDNCAVKVADAKVAIAKIRSDIANTTAEYAVLVQKGEPASEETKTEKREEYETALTKAKHDLILAEDGLKGAKQNVADAKAAQDKIDEELRAKKQEVKTASRDETQHLNLAVKDEKRADKIAQVVDGPVAPLSQLRSEHGAVSSLGERWKCTVTDVNLLPMELLWPFIPTEEKAIAARKWMLLQPEEKRVMPGTIMEIDTYAQTR